MAGQIESIPPGWRLFNNPDDIDIGKSEYGGYVYAIHFDDSKWKIGSSTNPRSRVLSLSRSIIQFTGMPVKYVMVSPEHTNYKQTEQEFHDLLNNYRVYGEVFDLEHDWMNEISGVVFDFDFESVKQNLESRLTGDGSMLVKSIDNAFLSNNKNYRVKRKYFEAVNYTWSKLHAYSSVSNDATDGILPLDLYSFSEIFLGVPVSDLINHLVDSGILHRDKDGIEVDYDYIDLGWFLNTSITKEIGVGILDTAFLIMVRHKGMIGISRMYGVDLPQGLFTINDTSTEISA